VRYAARTVSKPWFAIGGLDRETLPAALEAGAKRAVVVRAITDAADQRARPENSANCSG
jgi:thiamine-phosphate pyrophosphorylase